MAYIGNQPGTGVRSRFIYTATASQTTFSGADDNSKTLKYADSAYVDVFLNGVCLVPGTDYTASTKTSIVLTQAASLSDTLEVIAYDIASMSDMSASNGGTFQADVTFADGADIITASKGTDNVRLGENAGAAIASGGNLNVAVGKNALTSNTTGDYNIAIGANSLDANTTADYNTAVGYNALTANTTGTGNVAVGVALGANTTADDNTAMGNGALGSNTTGASNTAIGRNALVANTTADNNTALGMQALTANTTAASNTGVGKNALATTTTGGENSALGHNTLLSTTTGAKNTGIGMSALKFNTTASNNTAIGYNAGENITTGVRHTLIGSEAGHGLTTADDCTFVGRDSGYFTTGTLNTFVGVVGSGQNVTSGTKNTIIGAYNGNQDGIDIRTSSNNIVISDGDGNARLRCNQYGALSVRTDIDQGIYVFTGGTTNTNGKAMEFYDGDGHSCGIIRINQSANTVSYNTSSDYRLKENIVDLDGATTRLKQLKPKRFNYILDPDDTVHDGFLAHEVSSIVPEAISGDKDEVDTDGNPVYQGIDHSKLVPLLVATIKELEARIATLEGN